MIAKQEIYCRLGFLCDYKIQVNQNFIEKKRIAEDDYSEDGNIDIYLEKYQDFPSVKNRILELNKIWRERYPERERYWTKEEKEANSIEGLIRDDLRDIYISIELYNRWEDHMSVLVTYAGWMMPGHSRYTLEYRNKSKKLGDVAVEERTFVFHLPEWTDFDESDFISKEAACSLIKEWLDTGQYTQYFLNESGELETKKSPLNN